jgi:DNA topoisomerase-3
LQDHHALIPLAVMPPGAAQEEANVYQLVLRRFFAVLKPAYVYTAISVTADIAGFQFSGSGIEVLQTGWRSGLSDDGGLGQNVSGLREKAAYPLVSISREEKCTEPRKHFTYASLLQLMENPRNEEGGRLTGLGTPATRGSILQVLIDRQYAALQGKSVLITDKGKFLVETLRKNESLTRFISLPETTRWEERLQSDPAAFLDGIKASVREAVKSPVSGTYPQMEAASLGTCPLCGSPVREGTKSYYCSGYKGGCAFTLWKEIAHAALTAADAAILLAGKQTRLKKCKGKDGKPFSARWYLKDGGVAFEFENGSQGN